MDVGKSFISERIQGGRASRVLAPLARRSTGFYNARVHPHMAALAQKGLTFHQAKVLPYVAALPARGVAFVERQIGSVLALNQEVLAEARARVTADAPVAKQYPRAAASVTWRHAKNAPAAVWNHLRHASGKRLGAYALTAVALVGSRELSGDLRLDVLPPMPSPAVTAPNANPPSAIIYTAGEVMMDELRTNGNRIEQFPLGAGYLRRSIAYTQEGKRAIVAEVADWIANDYTRQGPNSNMNGHARSAKGLLSNGTGDWSLVAEKADTGGRIKLGSADLEALNADIVAGRDGANTYPTINNILSLMTRMKFVLGAANAQLTGVRHAWNPLAVREAFFYAAGTLNGACNILTAANADPAIVDVVERQSAGQNFKTLVDQSCAEAGYAPWGWIFNGGTISDINRMRAALSGTMVDMVTVQENLSGGATSGGQAAAGQASHPSTTTKAGVARPAPK